jgi:uncharacterized SAM-binding protein YcdF (DUF218 family)
VTVRSRRQVPSPGTAVDGSSPLADRTTRRAGLRRRVGVVAVVVLLAFTALTVRVFVSPSLPPLPPHVDAIIELGGPGDRDPLTMSLAEQHLAPVVIQSTTEGDVTPNCLPPVSGVSIECFHASPPTTRGEARYIGERAAASHWSSVIIVTTPDHAWRARLRVERCFPGQVYVATSPLPKLDWFRQIPYQWAATVKAELFQRDC